MAPILERDTDLEKYGGRVKFVRDGNVIAVDDPELDHAQIAETHSLGTPLNDTFCKREVDDAGRILDLNDELSIRGKAHTCRIRGDKETARGETAEIIQQITGRKTSTSEY
ncbi:hypothetical protein A3A76_00420 [Candidatus Woesebacteria bacterium RIFCSPLOWO2_01_FULL_39_23]|uniref:Uncharacterized protein n=1 Tax=Candidatus Woesebacteria bacterium RIFCSPHIGHO2_01_FULL_40_22 TaxID=1802499 RepID=A0A1F7YII4_9BACT|nr:MAG: hypothetical protein A2141_05965 [Candidatus Woesebacteria bacterium RBG_16_40_11]OGM27161.1 MAG: hypothetical protein A2628_03935 [Candidatus Woesebacteria bacterium RIFCSPHIGHO2_01_FULL_40_22]OGM36900.1 MAG: hypothetical protein A3E41_04985 [Candidatus Woesebacteria bacterium RIFCSPHIGHO2_12_FULL_38_9]OGM63327.1 MAG: hypothetical protein A3A76_00420 [Candidatus Woesebacteria bacterium RIFCSPLOWO2_01_FULL_39_23]